MKEFTVIFVAAILVASTSAVLSVESTPSTQPSSHVLSRKQAELPAILLITDHKGELPTLAALLKGNGYSLTLQTQEETGSSLTGYHAILVYVHKTLLATVENELINYAKSGGRLIVLHHGLATAKIKNPKWLELLGVKFYTRNDKKYPWGVTNPTCFCVVNLKPGHYITSNKVEYSREIEYTSRDRVDLTGLFPAFDIPNTEIYHNMRSTDGNAKVILLGSKFKADANDLNAANKPEMEETAGWYKRTGHGWAFYFQMGHADSDFRNHSFAQILLNALTWQPK